MTEPVAVDRLEEDDLAADLPPLHPPNGLVWG
jgi:hypothetical protein